MAQDTYTNEQDPNNPDYRQRMQNQNTGFSGGMDPNQTPQPAAAPPAAPPAEPAKDQNYWAQQIDPTLLQRSGGFQANDVDNINRYGIDPFVAELQKRAGSQTTGDPMASTGATAGSAMGAMAPGGDNWFKGWFEQQRTQAAAAEAERKARTDSLYNTWLGRSQRVVSPDDPNIKMQTAAYNANEERARRGYVSDQAEAAGPLANLRGVERQSAERMGQRTGTFESELVGRDLQRQRDEITQALMQMGGMLSQEQQAGLQRELAIIDASMQQQGLGLQGRSLDQDWQRALLSNNQFMADLGLKAENQYNYWNDPLRTGV